MKYLFLIRHAKSSWSSPELSDIKRPLNERGKNDAPLIGNILKKDSVSPDIIYSSPAARALTTAKIIAKSVGYPAKKIVIKPDIYEASVPDLLRLINSIEEKYNKVMIFGHNPGLSNLSNYLCNSFRNNMPTCGVVQLEFETNNWLEVTENSGSLIKFEYPKKYK